MHALCTRSLAWTAALGAATLWVSPASAQPAPTKPSTQPPATKASAAKGSAAKSNKASAPNPKAAPVADPTAPEQEGTAAAKFAKTFEDWKTLLKDLRKLKAQFPTATSAEQDQLREQWTVLLAKGNELMPQLTTAAREAYAEQPNADPQLTRFLVKMAADAIGRDEYQTARDISQILIDNEVDDKQVYDSAAIAAYVLNDYDQAAKHFKVAAEAGALSTYGSQLASNVEEQKELWAKEQEIRKAEEEANDLPRVKLTTSQGEIVIELFENEAPETVANFVKLVQDKFYDGLTFHRVLPNFMAQGGDPKGDGSGGPGYTIFDEFGKPEYRRHFRGSLSMAKTQEPDTGGSQFFLTFRPTPELNGRHTAFGRVIEGEEVLAKLQRRDPSGDPPLPEPDRILSAELLRKRDHAYEPRKVGQ